MRSEIASMRLWTEEVQREEALSGGEFLAVTLRVLVAKEEFSFGA